MTHDVWLYRNDYHTFRTVQRQTDEGAEVLLLGPQGQRAHERFDTIDAAIAFREAVAERILQCGFSLARRP
jgi:hypothetical protein